ncbi:MAG: tetratricopeptide repeat protein [Acidobacteriota bacterium]
MAELSAEARIRDLKRRLELDPGSRLFVTLAEEYRKTGRVSESLSTLQRGLLAHPGYLSAHVALGRAYLEAGQITEAIATFTKVLSNDPGNLVSAKSLADIYLSRGESVEAIKKYKLYRALSGDRSVDDMIERLQLELAPPPPPRAEPPALPPPPTFFEGKVSGPIRTSRDRFASASASTGPRRLPVEEVGESTSVKFELDDSFSRNLPAGPAVPTVLSRDGVFPQIAPAAVSAVVAEPASVPVASPVADPEPADLSTRAFRVADVLRAVPPPGELPEPAARPEPAAAGEAEESTDPEPEAADPGAEEQGRTLADLYFAQGHYSEALRIYDDLVAGNPFDVELKRLRRDAEARLLPAATARSEPEVSAALDRRLARVRALKHWLSMVQTG